MENRFTLRISRMFRSSFGSCRTRNISDVIQTQNKSFHMIEEEPPLSPKPRPFPSVCRPKCPETTIIINNACCIDSAPPRRKVSEQYSPFVFATSSGRMCPPASPISSFNNTYYDECKEKRKDRSVKKNKKKKRTHLRKTKTRSNAFIFSSSSQESFRAWSWFSSDDDEKEDETETLFSSKSLSSDSLSDLSLRRHTSRRNNKGTRRRRSSRSSRKSGSDDVLPLSGGNDNRVKDSFAVVKRSSDPYNDFRTSMVEMIVEKQIFAAEDLEQLLQCFLSLNSHHHHRIIVEVFMEIWEALFSNWS